MTDISAISPKELSIATFRVCALINRQPSLGMRTLSILFKQLAWTVCTCALYSMRQVGNLCSHWPLQTPNRKVLMTSNHTHATRLTSMY